MQARTCLHGVPCPPDRPRQRVRLIEIIQNLRERIREARGNGWLGEVEGLNETMAEKIGPVDEVFALNPWFPAPPSDRAES
jgi:hypothetical protein